jgi:hypothetical protein
MFQGTTFQRTTQSAAYSSEHGGCAKRPDPR